MRSLLRSKFLLIGLLVNIAICSILVTVFADERPDVPPPKSKYNEETICVEPVEVMRKRHFDFILDHRDRTVVEGIRTTQYSLNACIDCHITTNAKGEYARYSEESHFCASCHQFAAVTIDCFQCHADRPEKAIRDAINKQAGNDVSIKDIHQYLHKPHAPKLAASP